MKRVVAVSGGFDPVHVGHVRMFYEAKKLGDELVVILNNDNWKKLKRGWVFMPDVERKEILEALKPVDRVMLTFHKPGTTDMSICEELRALKPSVFANGGDRFEDNIPEAKVCRELGIEMVFNVGHGGKVQSSSELVEKAKKSKKNNSKSML
ncbi:MAG: adenylyltransferase/cytidyltransferase family protein [Candidatus Woesearchaeota archaeon]